MKKVLLIYGGNSSEHNVSCSSMKSIQKNIDNQRYSLTCVKITQKNTWQDEHGEINDIVEYLKAFDVIFPIIHGKHGEDGTLQGMLDMFDIPYVGSKCAASAICMDKLFTKQIAKDLNIPQVPYQVYEKDIQLLLPFPVIVKPANGGSSIGIEIANNAKELKKAIRKALKYDSKIIIEQFIKAQELEVAVLEDDSLIVSVPGEIVSANDFYDYNAKYENAKSQTLIPANIPLEVEAKIKEYATILFKKLDLHGLARIDFFYDKEHNQIYFNEINTLPGFTEISMYPKLMMYENITYQELISKLIESAK